MPAAFVQSKNDTTAGGSLTIVVTFTSNVTAGNLIVGMINWNGTGTITSIADGLSNTYTQVDTATQADNHVTFYAKNINGGACTITVTLNSSESFRSIIVHEVSGIDTIAPLDQHAINYQTDPGTGTNAVTSGSVTTTTAGQYIFGGVQVNNIGSGLTFAAGSGFTDRESHDADASTTAIESEDQIQSSAGSIAATFTGTGIAGSSTHTAILTFKPVIIPTFLSVGQIITIPRRVAV